MEAVVRGEMQRHGLKDIQALTLSWLLEMQREIQHLPLLLHLHLLLHLLRLPQVSLSHLGIQLIQEMDALKLRLGTAMQMAPHHPRCSLA